MKTYPCTAALAGIVGASSTAPLLTGVAVRGGIVDGGCCACRFNVVASIEEVDGCAGVSDGWAVATEEEGTSAESVGGGACLVEHVILFFTRLYCRKCQGAWREGYI